MSMFDNLPRRRPRRFDDDDDGARGFREVRFYEAEGPLPPRHHRVGGSGQVAPAFTFPAGAGALYSTRLIGGAYAGPALTVRRSSDNATLDIGFKGADFDTAAALAFAAGSILFVAKWYDQSGAGRDASQATAGNQPRLLIVGARAYLSFPGCLNTAAMVPVNGDQTIGVAHWPGVGSTAIFPLACFDGSNGWFLTTNHTAKQGGYYSSGAGAWREGGNVMAQSPARLSVTRASGAATVRLNGASVASGAASNGAPSGPLTIGGYNATPNFVGLISEIWLYPAALAADPIAAIDANQVSYWGNWGFATPYGGAAWPQLSTNDKIDCGNILEFEWTQPWTCFAAIQVYGAVPGQPMIIFTNVTVGPNFAGYEMWIDGPTGLLIIRLINDFTNGKYLDVTGSTNLVDGKQHFVCGTYDGSGLAAGVRLYVDGAPETLTTRLDALGALSIVASGQKMCIGWQQPSGTTMLGCLGHVQIDKIVRAPAYIAAHATPASLPPIDANTGMSFPLTEGTGTTVHDVTSNAYPATLSTAAVWVP